jgi:hypothetical protein
MNKRFNQCLKSSKAWQLLLYPKVSLHNVPGSGSNCNSIKVYDLPERTGKGDAIEGVTSPFIAIGSSSSSSGDMVSSDWLIVSYLQH